MNKKIIFQKIGGILSEINEQYQYLSANMENINDLELELFVANANFLSEHAIILKRINESQPSLAEPVNVAQQQTEPKEIPVAAPITETQAPVVERATNPEPAHKPEPIPVPVEEKVEVQAPVFQAPVYTEPASPVKPIEVVSEPAWKPAPELAVKPEPVMDTQPVKSPTLNDILSEKASQNTVARQYHAQSSDLKAIVSLNDKLLFVKDLFNGYSLAYSEAIELANRCNSYEEAVTFLQTTYADKNKWADKQSAADKLFEILSRRFVK